jgi:hypothetical protein
MLPEQPEQVPFPPPQRKTPGWLWIIGWVGGTLCICVVGIGAVVYLLRTLPEGILGAGNALMPGTPETVPPEGWNKIFSDSFVSNQNGWDGDQSFERGEVRRTVDQYVYNWRVNNIDDQLWFGFPGIENQSELTDLYFTAEVQMLTEAEEGMGYGLLIHYANIDNFYMLDVLTDSTWQIYAQVAGEWDTLTYVQRSRDLVPGGVNKLGVLVLGDRITVYINDRYQGDVTSDAIPSGMIGLMAEADEGQRMTVEFDNVEVYAP